MSDTGWRWVGPKPTPPPDPGPEPTPKQNRRWFLILGGVACLVIIVALLLHTVEAWKLRRQLAAAETRVDAAAPAVPTPAVAPENEDELARLREQLPRLRGEVQRLRAENEALTKKIAELETQGAGSRDPTAFANLQVRAFQLSIAAVNTLTARPEGSSEYREFAAMEALRRTFSSAGVEFPPPKSLYYNVNTGKLLVRASERDMAVIEQALVSGGLQ